MFVKHIIGNFIISKRYTRIAIVLYSTRTYKIYGFRRRQDRRSVYKAISLMRYPRRGTMTGKALWFTLRRIFHGARSRRVLIAITDGKSKDPVDRPARLLRRKGVQVMAVGVGRLYKQKTLFQIAGSRRYIFTSSFHLLGRLIRPIKQKICRSKCFECNLTKTYKYLNLCTRISFCGNGISRGLFFARIKTYKSWFK